MPFSKKNLFGDLLWASGLGLLLFFLTSAAGLKIFVTATRAHPVLMGYAKFFVLATMGELLAIRVVRKTWVFKGLHLPKKAVVWGFLGVLVTYAFPLFDAGVLALVGAGMLPVFPAGLARTVLLAFYKSAFLNVVFGFPFMVLHRFTDSLIDRPGPLLEVFKGIDWDNMWKVVGRSLIWFWIPAHTATFSFRPEFRILVAALLSICLGVILAWAKMKSRRSSV